MSRARVLVNNFIGIDNQSETDTVLKIYLTIGALLGADRLELYKDLKNLTKHLIRSFAIFLNVCIVLISVLYPRDGLGPRFLLAIAFVEYFLYCSWAFVSKEKVQSFFIAIRNFDRQIGYLQEQNGSQTVRPVMIQACVVILIFICICIISCVEFLLRNKPTSPQVQIIIPVTLLQAIELLMSTYCWNLLHHRLKMTVERFDTAFGNSVRSDPGVDCSDVANRKYKHDLNIARNSYRLIVEASDILKTTTSVQHMKPTALHKNIDTCQRSTRDMQIDYHVDNLSLHLPFWGIDIMITLILDFLPRLIFWYIHVMNIIHHQEMWWINAIFAISLETLNFYLQMLPCRICDQINSQVKELKATLAIHLSSSYLDKESRRLTRSLVSYVEQHDLSFRLLRVAGVSVSLPSKVLELTLTYLIILLQFGKLVENQLIVDA